MNQLGNTDMLGLICQVVDKDFYPVGDVFPVEVSPTKYIGVVAKDLMSAMRKTISDLSIINDLVSIDDASAVLWKLSKPCPIGGKGKDKRARVAVGNLLEDVRREQLSLIEELADLMGISDYFDGNLPRGHLHLLLQLAISGVDGANAFQPLRRASAH